MRKRSVVKVLGVGVALMFLLIFAGGATGWYLVFHDRGVNLDLDPAKIAASETRMWQAYYTQDATTLGIEIVSLLRGQFGLSYASAASVGESMARGAAVFALRKPNHEERAYNHLVDAYTRLAEISEATWDPEEAAALELQWWVDRRNPERRDVETVGGSIADLYALLYGQRNADIEAAGKLRAQAALLRDTGGKNADWPQIEAMLIESYSRLLDGVSG